MIPLFEIKMTTHMGRGVFALTDLQPGQRILQVDERDYLTYK